MNQDLQTGDNTVNSAAAPITGQDDMGANTANSRQANTDYAGQQGSGSDAGTSNERAANQFVSQAPAASMEDGRIKVGVEVFDASGETIGNVAVYDEAAGRLVVRKGWLFNEDTEFPVDAIGDKGVNGIFLTQTKAELQQQYADRMTAGVGAGETGSAAMDRAATTGTGTTAPMGQMGQMDGPSGGATMDQTVLDRGPAGGGVMSQDMGTIAAPLGVDNRSAGDTGRMEMPEGVRSVTYRAAPGGGLEVDEEPHRGVDGVDDAVERVERTDTMTTDR